MEIKPVPNPSKAATKWALISLLCQIVFTYAVQFLNLDMNSPIKWLGVILFIVFMLITQKEYKDQLGGYMTFGQGFSAGFRYAVYAGLLAGVFSYIYFGILSPDVFAKMMEPQRAAMEQKGMDAAAIEKAMQITLKYGALLAAFGAAIGDTIIGALAGLIGAAIFKKEKSPADVLTELENREAAKEDLDPTE